ncbi:organic solvent tolerance protein OstA [Selenomonadales bacterium OttesenSCG-928-I06]|nr:organic solvent tolerance protein OstA [Selenomonadales bacterium OttesenSCG-928-I06]
MVNNLPKKVIVPGVLAVFLFFIFGVFTLNIANNAPVEIEADVISYDSAKGTMQAEGNVKITQGNSVATAQKAEYDMNTAKGYLSGGVNAVRDDSTIIANEVYSYDSNNRILAKGSVVVTRGENRVIGPIVDYYVSRGYVKVPSNARLENKDGIVTSDMLEAYLDEQKITALGNVRVISSVHELDAIADKADYFGLPKEESEIIFTGNARVTQRGNTVTGHLLTVDLNDNSVKAEGDRPKVIFTPKSKG